MQAPTDLCEADAFCTPPLGHADLLYGHVRVPLRHGEQRGGRGMQAGRPCRNNLDTIDAPRSKTKQSTSIAHTDMDGYAWHVVCMVYVRANSHADPRAA